MKVSGRAVETGEIRRDQIRIMRGLSEGEKVAASAANLLREGMRVESLRGQGGT
jgi:hypothetical protein